MGTSLTGNSSTSQNDAFIYNLGGNGLVQDMNTVFASIIPAGWSLTVATAIDDNGDIAGYASTPSGYEGFVIDRRCRRRNRRRCCCSSPGWWACWPTHGASGSSAEEMTGGKKNSRGPTAPGEGANVIQLGPMRHMAPV